MWTVAIALCSTLLLARCSVVSLVNAAVWGDAERGAQIFAQGQADAPACSTCHHTVQSQSGFSVGPTLAGIAERARTRVAGMTAAEYVRQSILEPHRHVAPGYRNMMYPDYRQSLSDQDVWDLVAYLLTL